eukprot:Plantae.Rhodophyta-Hildenbrandia_rubra.ctg18554.p1 GENE.Plantae.Rhodophyta-Hildenbrandia_rubra.ctg18554~~Plantae.Rhodophyta-Hildenbrandia_rubra.ctg18554.p1  ORF type:complete len:139 (+),score=3.61 Plantae.Rhodophyta-Hildenbrandia_rubra.ctg18554:146-562(+)
MAFITSLPATTLRSTFLTSTRPISTKPHTTPQFSTSSKRAHFSPSTTATPVKMAAWDSPDATAPNSEVLGIGSNIPSTLYLILSVAFFGLGCWAVYQQNINGLFTAESIKPQYILGSLALPISWGLHVAGFIQRENKK